MTYGNSELSYTALPLISALGISTVANDIGPLLAYIIRIKDKMDHAPVWSVGAVLISLSVALSP